MAWTRRSRGKRAAIAFTGLRLAAAKVPDLVYLAGLIESGALIAVVHERYPFARVAEAHAAVDTGHKRGAAVLTL
jgi:NADPH:quinone reductase-like Zn-dependent oxidoreductase